MKYFSFLILCVLLVACGQKETKDPSTSQTAPPQSKMTASGQELYTQKCTACHGADGNMGIAGAKKLPESVLTQQERETVIAGGKNTMPAFKDQLTTEEIKAIAEYTLTLK